jgi:hypothetical protein
MLHQHEVTELRYHLAARPPLVRWRLPAGAAACATVEANSLAPGVTAAFR